MLAAVVAKQKQKHRFPFVHLETRKNTCYIIQNSSPLAAACGGDEKRTHFCLGNSEERKQINKECNATRLSPVSDMEIMTIVANEIGKIT